MSVPQYRIRCSEVLKKALLAAGADAVRGVLEERFLSEEQRRSRQVEVPAGIVEAVRRLGAERAMEMMTAMDAVASSPIVAIAPPPGAGAVLTADLPSVSPMEASVAKHPLEDEKTESGAPSWPGPYGGEEGGDDSTDTPAVAPRAPVLRPAVKVFSRTEEERAEKLKLLGGILGVGNEEQNQEP